MKKRYKIYSIHTKSVLIPRSGARPAEEVCYLAASNKENTLKKFRKAHPYRTRYRREIVLGITEFQVPGFKITVEPLEERVNSS